MSHKKSQNTRLELPKRFGWLLLLIAMICTLFYGIEVMNQVAICDGGNTHQSAE